MTAPTLPAMSRPDIDALILSSEALDLGSSVFDLSGDKVDFAPSLRDFARAILAARDAQWSVREQSLRARILELEADHEHGAGVIEQMRAEQQAVVDAAVRDEREKILDECLHTCGAVTALELSKTIRARTKA